MLNKPSPSTGIRSLLISMVPINTPLIACIQTIIGEKFYFLGAFFLPATVLRFPFRVRLLVLVRWPLTGSPFLCRSPL